MSYSYNFPSQRIPESKKDLDWHISHAIGYLNYTATDNYTLKKEEILSLYYSYAAKLTDKKRLIVEKTITERCGENFGPEYAVYPLIENKIDELVGKYRKRPLRRHLSVSNPDSVNKKLDAKMDMITEQIMRQVNEELQPDLGFVPETNNPEMQLPEDIEEFFAKDYRTLAEETGNKILNHVLIVRKEKEKVFESLKHYLICERTFSFLTEKNGHPSIYVPHVLDCFYDVDPNESVQDNFNYFVFDKYMSINEILNTFENLSEEEKILLENYSGVYQRMASANGNFANTTNTNLWYKNDGGLFKVRVVSMLWKSRKKVRFLSVTNKETGAEEYKILDESKKEYKERSRDNLKSIEIEDIRHITMAGPDIVLNWGSLKDQMQTIGDKKVRFVPMVGLIRNNPIGTGEIRSICKKLDYLQEFASEILYEIRLAARQTDGNLMAYDTAMTPKNWLALGEERAMQKVNYHIKRDKMIVFNSKDKRSNPYASSVNVSNKGHMQELVQMLALIEDLADKISGVRSGQNPYQKAATAEINYEQDTDRVEEYFGVFDTYYETVLERLLLKAKTVYTENQVFSYFGGDNLQRFLTIFPDFFINDYDVSIADNRREYENKRRLDEVAGNTFSNAGSPRLILDLLKIWNTESVSEGEAILERGINALEKIRQENNAAAQQQAEAQAKLEQDKLAKQDEQNDKKLVNNKEVAYIYADNNADGINTKEMNANLRKMAEIERDLKISDDNKREKTENLN